MGFDNGDWFCDVCSATISLGNKRYPLDSGSICCKECWNEIHGASSSRVAPTALNTEKLQTRSAWVLTIFAVALVGVFAALTLPRLFQVSEDLDKVVETLREMQLLQFEHENALQLQKNRTDLMLELLKPMPVIPVQPPDLQNLHDFLRKESGD